MSKTLFILNDAPYGTERSYDMARLPEPTEPNRAMTHLDGTMTRR